MRRRTLRSSSARSRKLALERLEGRALLATFLVTSTSDTSTSGTLRYEITQSNLTPGSNTIDFDIAASGVQTIDVTSALPAITVPVVIDGTSEPVYAGTPLVELDGAGAGTGVDGLDILAGATTVKGLAINRFGGSGINITATGSDTITADDLGTDPTGTIAEGNGNDGVYIQANANANTISGNVISGNTVDGIRLDGSAGGSSTTSTTGNLIANNRIGTDVTGTLTLGNAQVGIYVQNAPMTTIGGTVAADRNIVSGNGTGMELSNDSDDSLIEGNYVGTDITGTVALGNDLPGGFFEDNVVFQGMSNSTFGGTVAGAGNLVSGGAHYGIDTWVPVSQDVTIQGNLVGTDVTGTKSLPNASGGIVFVYGSSVTIGGTAAGAGNVISGNGGAAIHIGTTSAIIQGNLIGTDITGTKALGNNGDGIDDSGSTNVTIGGTAAGAGNVISANTDTGISDSSPGVSIEGNFIGTDVTGTLALGNTGDGIMVSGMNTTIGGTVATARNLVSANLREGIIAQNATNTTIEGNYVGTDVTGTLALGNMAHGILALGGTGVTIGGTVSGAGNLVSANKLDGILDQGVTVSIIEGNLVGTDVTGTEPLGNLGDGIFALGDMGSTTIGGTLVAARNVVSDNGADGISVQGSMVLIEGNIIGTDATGTLALGNGGDGVNLFGNNCTVGGLAAGAGNVIANNGVGTNAGEKSGIGLPLAGVVDCLILSNSIHNNFNLGIDLAGGNNNQSAPVVSLAFTTATSSTIAGTLTTADGTYTVQLFATPTLNTSGNAEGQRLLDTITVTVTGGSASFSDSTASPFTSGDYITATATDALGNTSMFSPGFAGEEAPVLPTFLGTGSVADVPIGQQVTDTFTIFNSSSTTPDSGLFFSDPIPAGVSYISGTTSTGVIVLDSGGIATAAIGDLAAGASVTVTIILSPTLAASPSFTNTAEVTASVPLVTGGVLDAAITTTVDPTADLSVVITGPSSSQIGQPLVYTVTTTNNGPSAATGVTITDSLPGNVTYSTSSSSSGQTPVESNGTITDSVATLAAGATEVLTITVIPTFQAVPSVSDSAVVSANEFDPNPINNLFTLVTPVNPIADLAITDETVSSSSVPIGTMVTFVIDLRNNGPSAATNTVVTDTLPAGLMFLTGMGAAGSASVVGGVISIPVGTLFADDSSVVTIVALTTSAGAFTNRSTASSSVADPDLSNNTGSATLTVTPIADVSVTLSSSANGSVYSGTVLTYTAVFTNSGPSTATNVGFTESIPSGTTFITAEVDGVAETPVNGFIELSVPSLPPDASVTVLLAVLADGAGTVIGGVLVSAAEPDPNLANNSASVSTTVVQPMSFIAFASANYAVDDTSGEVAITLVRSNDFADDVTVHFSTFGGNAVPGVDYDPVSETVDFPAGSTSASVLIPVLAYPYNNQNHIVGLEIDSPTGSGILVSPTTAVLTIIDVNPDIVGPVVTAIKLTGYTNSITSIEIDTTSQLNPATADNPANYTLIAYGTPTGAGLPLGTSVLIATAAYDAATGAIFIVPSQALPGNELFLLDVHGTGPSPITDLAGNPLNSIAGVKPGSDYLLSVARGTDIVYPNENGDPVTLKLTGPGTIDIDRYVAGDLEILQVVGGVAGKTVITGSVHPTLQRSRIGQILGLGQFGSIPFKLTTPGFYLDGVTAFPNINSQVDAPAIDTLLPSPPAPTVTKSKGKPRKVATPKATASTEHEKVVKVARKPAVKHR